MEKWRLGLAKSHSSAQRSWVTGGKSEGGGHKDAVSAMKEGRK